VIAFQVLNFIFIHLGAVGVELLAHLLSQNIQDHRRTTPWPLASVTFFCHCRSQWAEWVCLY